MAIALKRLSLYLDIVGQAYVSHYADLSAARVLLKEKNITVKKLARLLKVGPSTNASEVQPTKKGGKKRLEILVKVSSSDLSNCPKMGRIFTN